MKLPIIACAVVFAFAAKGVTAACNAPATQIQDAGLGTLLTGKMVCAVRGGDRWQEEHHSDGELWDYKRGDGHPIDPRKKVGTWAVSGSGANTIVTYTYTPGGTYSYGVWDNGGGSYSFCGTGGMDFTVKAMGSPCP
ncbi:MAG: hypothetical protein HY272_05650 [Gammaproteobacteria bacterium]|nr:hypothetical protein [Gammaproteobacteria bacterium]